ncbi:radical SAM family heme chaperone HemW [Arenimonas metalli]|uniref:Heme chaperone HemW n=1 Tax=Arenimonas metalli CF5-1 TaxID=1384056 RepID=A0A091ASP0_9GAMM|nr:radical SAM family heme chaperone HemW [Arenimonas metalli]KFN41984.1 coproporphyrinogen III oxidase [Arenimonas metalli CF5-1]
MSTLIPPPLSLYIHIPWCVKKCPYCDFNSHGQSGALPVDEYIAALVRDLEQDLPLVWGRTVHSVFFGGGTPSLFAPGAIGAILDACSSRLRFAPGAEITMECNPGTAEHGRFEQYRAAGVNRISFGIQSFDDGCLKRLGRIHDSGEAERAVKLAQDAGYDNLNLDLMYALPGQDLAMALHDVERAIALQPAHLSHYQLTMEPNTAFAVKPPEGLPGEDDAWDIQERCIEAMAAAGYAQYEVSAYARPGRQCAHNLNYWRFGDYLGIGAGAHGKISSGATGEVRRRWKPKNPRDFIAHAGTAKGIGGDDPIAPASLPFDYMLNALRLVEGFRLADFESRTGLDRAVIAAELEEARVRGWLEQDGEHWRPTELGRRFTNDVIGLFLD